MSQERKSRDTILNYGHFEKKVVWRMARIARVIAQGIPHHVTQRGNRRQKTFFCEEDYQEYINLMGEWCRKLTVEIWAYCLMPNHVHLVVVPKTEEGLRKAIGEAHRRYTRYVNFREGWKGHLWQGRFSSFPMDEKHLVEGMRYVEMNPVRAGFVKKAWEYPWSSARAHVKGEGDALVQGGPMKEEIGDWKVYLKMSLEEEEWERIRRPERTGRPMGDERFIERLEKRLDRTLRKQKPGRKKGN